MVRLSSTDITDAVNAVEAARRDMGRGFFWYTLEDGSIVVRDNGLTDTGYMNLAVLTRKRINLSTWFVVYRPEHNCLLIEAREKNT